MYANNICNTPWSIDTGSYKREFAKFSGQSRWASMKTSTSNGNPDTRVYRLPVMRWWYYGADVFKGYINPLAE
ncbi:hypothetical protein TNCV_2520391 [Trichonephila clavipes]|uniref:Uncharacterized protein n=1 Tax=Trichonephila clavipes TaxID=2585209 RepID=A0A8X6RLF1_TRICX|nr:hypothetical protein TNCV_2520391 [Trichonephila clavipes]